MIKRQLTLGSATRHNAAEQIAARQWHAPCFPRFYQYDILRGLDALLAWAKRANRDLPAGITDTLTGQIDRRFPNGTIKIERRFCEGHGTITRRPDGTWDNTQQPALSFPLLDAVSVIGAASPYLSRQWARVNQRYP